jgi:hypothetical protein
VSKVKQMSEMAKYINLLNDPCSGEFSPPPYAGTDSGYLIRTQEIIQVQAAITGGVTGQVIPIDAGIQVIPTAYNTGATAGLAYVAGSAGVSFILPSQISTSWAVSASVRKVRPVAACLKFLPTGPYATRQGVVGVGYSGGCIALPNTEGGTVTSAGQLLTAANFVAPVGATSHEVKWLPCSVDEAFSDVATTDNSSLAGGTMFMGLQNVDAICISSTVAQLNGYFEATIVWEWLPKVADGLVPAPRKPLPFTTQQALSTIGDIGSFLFGNMSNGFFREAVTYGVRQMMRRAPAVPLLTYR